MIKHFYTKLPGFTDFEDIYADEVKRAQDGAVFVEIGTYCARSLGFMAVEIANSGKNIHMTSFDLWNHFSRHPEWTFEKIERQFVEAGVRQFVDFCQSDSAKAAERYADGSVDFCFIDGDHSKKGCMRDIVAWWPKAKPGSTFAGHDMYRNNPKNDPRMWPGVRDSVFEFFNASGQNPRDVQVRGTSWVVIK